MFSRCLKPKFAQLQTHDPLPKGTLKKNEKISKKEAVRESQEGQTSPQCMEVIKMKAEVEHIPDSRKATTGSRRMPTWLMSRVKETLTSTKWKFFVCLFVFPNENKMAHKSCVNTDDFQNSFNPILMENPVL